jgi:hypothetical protein
MGLGINYPASGVGSHGCQIAIPRNVTNPSMSIHFKENNAWTAWSGVTAGVLRGNAVFTTNAWQTSSDNVSRFNFTNAGATNFSSGNGFHIFKNQANSIDTVTIDNDGDMSITGNICTGTAIPTTTAASIVTAAASTNTN